MQSAYAILSSVACRALKTFCTLSHKRQDFRGGGGGRIEHKMCFDVLLTVHLSTFISVFNQLYAHNLFHNKFYFMPLHVGTAVAQWLKCCATNRNVAGSIPASVSGFFIDIKSFRSHNGPGVDSASNRNEYQEYSLGVKAAGA